MAILLISFMSPSLGFQGSRNGSPSHLGIRCRWKWKTVWNPAASFDWNKLRPSGFNALRIAFDEYVYGIRHDSTLRGLKQMRITQLIH